MSAQPVFLHFLNREVLRLYGWTPDRISRMTGERAHVLTRCALLISSQPVLIPPASLFEFDFADRYIADISAASDLHLVEYISPTADLGEYATKKRREYRDQLSLFSRYAGPGPFVNERLLDRLIWRPRVKWSASEAITKEWVGSLSEHEGAVYDLLSARTTRGMVTRLETRLAGVPRRLDGRAFLPGNVISLLPEDLADREVTNVALLISRAYVRSFLEEYDATILVETPFGVLDCGIESRTVDGQARTLSYRRIRDVLRQCSVGQLLERRTPLSDMLEVSHQPVFDWFRALLRETVTGRSSLLTSTLVRNRATPVTRYGRGTVRATINRLHDLFEAVTKVEQEHQRSGMLDIDSTTARGVQLDLWGGGTVVRNALTQDASNLQAAATIGIIAALPKEFAALKAVFGSVIDWTAPGRGAGRRYGLVSLDGSNGRRHVTAIALLPDVGNNSAAARSTRLLEHFPNVNHVIMCGIAGGIPTPRKPERYVHLGDVVVANEFGVIQYDFVKRNEWDIEARVRPRPPAALLREAVQHLEADALLGHRPWEKYLVLGGSVHEGGRPDDSVDAEGKPISYPGAQRAAGEMRVFAGPIAAANTLLKDPALRDSLHQKYGVLAVEMESSGIADASWNFEAGYFTVRGICDYCDPAKGDVWQGFAAVSAAAYVRALIESMPASISG